MQRLVVGTHRGTQGVYQGCGAGVEHMGLEAEASATTQYLEEHPLASVDQATAAGKSAADAAIGQHIEHLAIGGSVAVDELHADLAIERGQTTDIDLVVEAGAGAGAGATDLEDSQAGGDKREIARDVLHTWRVTRPQLTFNHQVASESAAALQRGVGRNPQALCGRASAQARKIKCALIEALQARRRTRPCQRRAGLGQVQRPGSGRGRVGVDTGRHAQRLGTGAAQAQRWGMLNPCTLPQSLVGRGKTRQIRRIGCGLQPQRTRGIRLWQRQRSLGGGRGGEHHGVAGYLGQHPIKRLSRTQGSIAIGHQRRLGEPVVQLALLRQEQRFERRENRIGRKQHPWL